MTLLEVVKRLNTNKKSLIFMAKIRWPERVTCPRCNSEKIAHIHTRSKYECLRCKYQFNAIAGSIFSKTYVPLHKWIIAVYLFCTHSGKLKPAELSRTLDLPYKTAWHMVNKVKKNSKNYDFPNLAGLFEAL